MSQKIESDKLDSSEKKSKNGKNKPKKDRPKKEIIATPGIPPLQNQTNPEPIEMVMDKPDGVKESASVVDKSPKTESNTEAKPSNKNDGKAEIPESDTPPAIPYNPPDVPAKPTGGLEHKHLNIKFLPLGPRREVILVNKFFSMFKVYQSRLGASFGLMPNGMLKIDDFDGLVDFELARMKLLEKVYDKYKGIRFDIPSYKIATDFPAAFPTLKEDMGIDLYEWIMATRFVNPDVDRTFKEGILNYSNTTSISRKKTMALAVNVLTPSERELSVTLQDLEFKNYVTHIDTRFSYLVLFDEIGRAHV